MVLQINITTHTFHPLERKGMGTQMYFMKSTYMVVKSWQVQNLTGRRWEELKCHSKGNLLENSHLLGRGQHFLLFGLPMDWRGLPKLWGKIAQYLLMEIKFSSKNIVTKTKCFLKYVGTMAQPSWQIITIPNKENIHKINCHILSTVCVGYFLKDSMKELKTISYGLLIWLWMYIEVAYYWLLRKHICLIPFISFPWLFTL